MSITRIDRTKVTSREEQWEIPGVGTFPSRPDTAAFGDYQWAEVTEHGETRLKRYRAVHQYTPPKEPLTYDEWARKQGLI